MVSILRQNGDILKYRHDLYIVYSKREDEHDIVGSWRPSYVKTETFLNIVMTYILYTQSVMTKGTALIVV